MWSLFQQRKNMNHRKHVIPKKVSTSVNPLSKYLEGKIKASTLAMSAQICQRFRSGWTCLTPSYIYIGLHRHGTIFWSDMSDLGRICPILVGRFWKMILFQWLWTTPILVDYETNCVGNLIFLSFHAYEERPNRRSYTSWASILSQDSPRLWVWLEVRLCNPELDWISILESASPWLYSTLFMSHMSSMIHSLILWELTVSREWKKKGMRSHNFVSMIADDSDFS
jgi:hypothetical protein